MSGNQCVFAAYRWRDEAYSMAQFCHPGNRKITVEYGCYVAQQTALTALWLWPLSGGPSECATSQYLARISGAGFGLGTG